jgi:uncharacterized protein (DUF433 family)
MKAAGLWPERIVIEPEILAGRPVVRGTRLAVEFILELLAARQSEAAILANYPGLTRDDILACLAYASYLAHEQAGHAVTWVRTPFTRQRARESVRPLVRALSKG